MKALKNIKKLLRSDGIMILSTFLRCDDEAFWLSEKNRWSKGDCDNRLVDYGDIFIRKKNTDIYIHIPSKISFMELIFEADFDLIECVQWYELVEEDKKEDIHNA